MQTRTPYDKQVLRQVSGCFIKSLHKLVADFLLFQEFCPHMINYLALSRKIKTKHLYCFSSEMVRNLSTTTPKHLLAFHTRRLIFKKQFLVNLLQPYGPYSHMEPKSKTTFLFFHFRLLRLSHKSNNYLLVYQLTPMFDPSPASDSVCIKVTQPITSEDIQLSPY